MSLNTHENGQMNKIRDVWRTLEAVNTQINAQRAAVEQTHKEFSTAYAAKENADAADNARVARNVREHNQRADQQLSTTTPGPSYTVKIDQDAMFSAIKTSTSAVMHQLLSPKISSITKTMVESKKLIKDDAEKLNATAKEVLNNSSEQMATALIETGDLKRSSRILAKEMAKQHSDPKLQRMASMLARQATQDSSEFEKLISDAVSSELSKKGYSISENPNSLFSHTSSKFEEDVLGSARTMFEAAAQ